MDQRTIHKHSSPQEARGKKEAAVDTQDTTGQDQRKVAVLAFALYEQRGREDGHDLDDWLEAEQRVESRGEGGGF